MKSIIDSYLYADDRKFLACDFGVRLERDRVKGQNVRRPRRSTGGSNGSYVRLNSINDELAQALLGRK